jgi:RNA polymerase sigma factor for flagellar operon FliA
VSDGLPQTPDLVPAEKLRAKITAAYAQQSREASEEKWILGHLPLVRHIVQKITLQVSKRLDVDDLISAGTLGLVKAARTFDPGRDVEFKTYAYIRIRGAVIDELRRRSFVPSTVHAKVRRVQAAYREHLAAHSSPPSDEELARLAGVSLERLYHLLEEARKQHFLSIHGLSDDKPGLAPLIPADKSPGPADHAQQKEALDLLTQAIAELPERDRTIILLYYERDLTMKEAAQVLGLTESRISQLHAAALFKLSMRLRSVL